VRWRGVELALLNQMKKRDWAFVAACVAGALMFGIWASRSIAPGRFRPIFRDRTGAAAISCTTSPDRPRNRVPQRRTA